MGRVWTGSDRNTREPSSLPDRLLSSTALPDVLQRHHRRALSAGRRHVCGVRPVGHQPAHRDHFLLRGNHNLAADNVWMQVRLGCRIGMLKPPEAWSQATPLGLLGRTGWSWQRGHPGGHGPPPSPYFFSWWRAPSLPRVCKLETRAHSPLLPDP